MVTIYSASFLQYLGFAAQVPNVVFNWLNIFVKFGLVVNFLVNFFMLFLWFQW